MKRDLPRKRLTERVADRKAGRKEAPDRTPKQKAVRNSFELFGNVLAMFGLFMLAYTVFRSGGSTDWATDTMIMYSMIFVVGRALKTAADSLSRLF